MMTSDARPLVQFHWCPRCLIGLLFMFFTCFLVKEACKAQKGGFKGVLIVMFSNKCVER